MWLSVLSMQVILTWISMFNLSVLISVIIKFTKKLIPNLDDNKWQLVFDFTKDESGQK